MEYLYWQRGGGGKDGTDPIYYFTLESTKPSTSPSSGKGMEMFYESKAVKDLEEPSEHQHQDVNVKQEDEEEEMPAATAPHPVSSYNTAAHTSSSQQMHLLVTLLLPVPTLL